MSQNIKVLVVLDLAQLCLIYEDIYLTLLWFPFRFPQSLLQVEHNLKVFKDFVWLIFFVASSPWTIFESFCNIRRHKLNDIYAYVLHFCCYILYLLQTFSNHFLTFFWLHWNAFCYKNFLTIIQWLNLALFWQLQVGGLTRYKGRVAFR